MIYILYFCTYISVTFTVLDSFGGFAFNCLLCLFVAVCVGFCCCFSFHFHSSFRIAHKVVENECFIVILISGNMWGHDLGGVFCCWFVFTATDLHSLDPFNCSLTSLLSLHQRMEAYKNGCGR